ncbi:homocysteine S-methyltransferase family protein, partial [Mesorhizobium sp. BH1-1-5]
PHRLAAFRGRGDRSPRLVGGCCEVGPAHIAALRDKLTRAGHQISGVS